MTICLGGSDEWIASCRTALSTTTDVFVVSSGDLPLEGLPLLISGSSGDWYNLVDLCLKRGERVFLGNPGSWSFHDLTALQHVADESGVEMWTYRPWRRTLPHGENTLRLVRISVTIPRSERWKPFFGHAVDRVLDALDTDNLMRADASRIISDADIMSMLLINLRFQNGSMAQISLERGQNVEVRMSMPSGAVQVSEPESRAILRETAQAFLDNEPNLPTLNEALAGRKIEEKIFSILRTR